MDPLSVSDLATIIEGRALSDAGDTSDVLAGEVVGVSTDSRTVRSGDLFVPIRGDRFDGHDYIADVAGTARASLVERDRLEATRQSLQRRGQRGGERNDLGLVVVEDSLEALEKLAAWQRASLNARVVAITGSVGKTTVKEFTGQLLARTGATVRAPKSFNNRLGVALTLLDADRSTRYLVAELGTSAPGEIARLASAVRPDLALVTAVEKAHLEGLGDLDGVAEAKAEIVTGLPAGGVLFLPGPIHGESTFLRAAICRDIGVRRFGWASSPGSVGADFRITECRRVGLVGYEFVLNGSIRFELPLPGRHNVFNCVAAIALCCELGLSWNYLRERVRELVLPPQRLEVADVEGVTFVDDGYNANPASFRGALEAIGDLATQSGSGRWFLVAGDCLELGPAAVEAHRDLGHEIGKRGIFAKVWTVGDSADETARVLDAAGVPVESCRADGTERLSESLVRALRPGDGVLFKASRGLQLERIAERVKKEWAASRTRFDAVVNGEDDHVRYPD